MPRYVVQTRKNLIHQVEINLAEAERIDAAGLGRVWTPKQKQWLIRIGRALRAQPVSDPEILADPLFAQAGGYDTVDREFDHGLGEVLKDLNTAIWDSRVA